MRLLIGLLMILIVFSANAAKEYNFASSYKCHGTDPYLNKSYTGNIFITPQNTVYNVIMQYDTGEKYIGTGGLYDNDTIAVVFQDPNDLRRVGLERYSVSKDDTNKIEGYWVYLGSDKLGKEICEKI